MRHERTTAYAEYSGARWNVWTHKDNGQRVLLNATCRILGFTFPVSTLGEVETWCARNGYRLVTVSHGDMME